MEIERGDFMEKTFSENINELLVKVEKLELRVAELENKQNKEGVILTNTPAYVRAFVDKKNKEEGKW